MKQFIGWIDVAFKVTSILANEIDYLDFHEKFSLGGNKPLVSKDRLENS